MGDGWMAGWKDRWIDKWINEHLEFTRVLHGIGTLGPLPKKRTTMEIGYTGLEGTG